MSRHGMFKMGIIGALLATVSLAHAKPSPQLVSLRFTETEMATVISSLATQVGFDAIIGSGVTGPVSINLTDVQWEAALDAIVTANGLAYHWDGDILVVLGADEQAGGVMEHRVVHLKHANPSAVQTVLSSVKSTNAQIAVMGLGDATPPAGVAKAIAPPVLVISETSYRMPTLLALIDSLDVPRPQFEIAVRFIETSIDDKLGYGFNWPTSVGASIKSEIQTNNSSQETTEQSGPAAMYKIPDGKIWRFGTLNVDQLSGFMEFLEQNGKSQLLSDPRVTVLENETANMNVTTTFPVQTVTRFTEGAATQDIVDFDEIEVGITLTVTPRLNDQGAVTLQVEPSVEEITGFTGPPDNRRPITANRRVATSVRVKDNETLVIGGLVREVDVDTKTKVFLLGNIPILGSLFTHTKSEKQKTDLLIFITPRILTGAEGT